MIQFPINDPQPAAPAKPWQPNLSAEELLDRFNGVFRSLAGRMLATYPNVGRWEDTGDVWQIAAMKLYKAINEAPIESELHFFRLASLVIRRTLLDAARHYSRPGCLAGSHETWSCGGQLENVSDPARLENEPVSLLAWTEFHEYVDRLDKDVKDVFDLLWYLELSQEQASELLNVSVRTIQRRWRNARVALYRDLKIKGESPRSA